MFFKGLCRCTNTFFNKKRKQCTSPPLLAVTYYLEEVMLAVRGPAVRSLEVASNERAHLPSEHSGAEDMARTAHGHLNSWRRCVYCLWMEPQKRMIFWALSFLFFFVLFWQCAYLLADVMRSSNTKYVTRQESGLVFGRLFFTSSWARKILH